MESRLSLIVRVNVVLTRTVAVDSDWRFDNLCGCHLQKEYVHPDDQTQPTFEMTPGFKPFTVLLCSGYANALFTGKRFILWIVSSTFGTTGTWTAKQAIYNCRPERLRSELNYLTANQFICTERPHKEWYSMFICLVQRLNCMWQIFYLLDESTSSRFNHYNRIKRSTILKTYIVAVKCKKKKDDEESRLDLLSEPYIVWIQGLLKLHVNSHGIQNVHLWFHLLSRCLPILT